MKISKMRALRLQTGLTQRTMAELVGISQTHYCRMETGWLARVNSVENEKLIRIFGEGFDSLKELVEVPEPQEIIKRFRDGAAA